jgi:hypothetical protein
MATILLMPSITEVSRKHAAATPAAERASLHLDAARITAAGNDGLVDGARVARWEDISRYNYHALQAAEEQQPAFQADADGYPAVRFDGEGSYLSIGPAFGAPAAYTICAVVSKMSPTRPAFLMGAVAAGNSASGAWGLVGVAHESADLPAEAEPLPDVMSAARLITEPRQRFLVTVTHAQGVSTLRFNGQVAASLEDAGIGSGNGRLSFYLGRAGFAEDLYWDGDLFELFLFREALEAAALSDLETDLLTKFAIV